MSNVSTHIANQRFNDPKHEKIVHACLYKITTNPDMLAKSHGMELSDLEQYGYEAFWKACLTYKEEEQKVQFNTYAMNNIKWRIMNLLNFNESALIKHPIRNGKADKSEMHSMDAPFENSEGQSNTYYDLLYNDTNDYSNVVEKLQFSNYVEELTSKSDLLTDNQKQIIGLRIKGLDDSKISGVIGYSRQYIGKERRKVKATVENIIKEKLYA